MRVKSANSEHTGINKPTLLQVVWWSLAIHVVALLSVWNDSPEKPVFAGSSFSIALASPAHIKLQSTEATKAIAPAKKPPIIKSTFPEESIYVSAAKIKVVTNNNPALEMPAEVKSFSTEQEPDYNYQTVSIEEPVEAQQIQIETESRLHSSLGNQLRKYFHYPMLARIKGWQGKVKLGLRVEGSGELSHIRLMQSSGYASLDHAALQSLRKIDLLPDARDWLHGMYYDIVVPVEFQLIDS